MSKQQTHEPQCENSLFEGENECLVSANMQNDVGEAKQTSDSANELTENSTVDAQKEQQNEETNPETGDSGREKLDNEHEALIRALEFAQDQDIFMDQQPEGLHEPSQEEKIAGLEAQLVETHDQLLRKAADFENFRKRMNQEKQNAIEFANQNLLLDIVPIIDDFERAIQAAQSSNDFASLLDGITMIEKRLTGQLESKWGLKRFDSAGEPFDPNRHEALMMDKSPDISEPVVQEDLIKGYMLKDRVIRAAKVKVLMPAGEGNRE
jgi:molecular chaperone GrpE